MLDHSLQGVLNMYVSTASWDRLARIISARRQLHALTDSMADKHQQRPLAAVEIPYQAYLAVYPHASGMHCTCVSVTHRHSCCISAQDHSMLQ